MEYTLLPVTSAPRHIFLLDIAPDGIPLRAEVELRYLPAPDQWILSIRDHENKEELVRQLPLICSYGTINDLLSPFRHLRQGRGLGSLFVLKNTDHPDTPDPAENTLSQFQILWGDTYDPSLLIPDES